ncbi:MAG: regulator [Candidatus Hydrogenedentes bacterium]|nr:regulator [Candidatus Hydrogenedentota bacterium]
MSRFPALFVCLLAITITPHSMAGGGPEPDVPYVQEYHERYPLATPDENDVRAIAVDTSGSAWIATKMGVRVLRDGAWSNIGGKGDIGKTFDVAAGTDGSVWVGAWDGLYRFSSETVEKIDEVKGPVAAIGLNQDGLIAAGIDVIWRFDGKKWKRIEGPWSGSPRAVCPLPNNGFQLGTTHGLFERSLKGDSVLVRENELVSGFVQALAMGADGRLWIGQLGGVDVYRNGQRLKHLTAAEGLPNYNVRALAIAPDGAVWMGTELGVVRYDGTWSLRHGLRWLVSNDVRDLAVASDGAVWVATDKGVSAIKRRDMTLAAKADEFMKVCRARHIREPGIVRRCALKVQGDVSTSQFIDDDNDGSYTAYYLVMQAFRYAATKDPDARAEAKRAFDVLVLLQRVTGTEGFFARTIVPVDWGKVNDANEEVTGDVIAERRVREARWKQVDERWRPSADGKWLWKGDTSSDETVGHYFGYFFYYTLVADDAEKEYVRQHVRRVTDHIVDGGLVLTDIDGTHTRWGVWAPERLNHDPNWTAERGINSMEILSFLKVAHTITGDAKYDRVYRELIEKHGYAKNASNCKTFILSQRTHIDDELLAMTLPGLLLSEKDPTLREYYLRGLEQWYSGLKDDQSYWFDFVYRLCSGRDTDVKQSVEYMRDAPLDLIEWTMDNTSREDLRLVRRPEIDPLQTDRLVPPSERAVAQWDRNPWIAVQGMDGYSEAEGVAWLMPYWMGRCYGYIAEPK